MINSSVNNTKENPRSINLSTNMLMPIFPANKLRAIAVTEGLMVRQWSVINLQCLILAIIKLKLQNKTLGHTPIINTYNQIALDLNIDQRLKDSQRSTIDSVLAKESLATFLLELYKDLTGNTNGDHSKLQLPSREENVLKQSLLHISNLNTALGISKLMVHNGNNFVASYTGFLAPKPNEQEMNFNDANAIGIFKAIKPSYKSGIMGYDLLSPTQAQQKSFKSMVKDYGHKLLILADMPYWNSEYSSDVNHKFYYVIKTRQMYNFKVLSAYDEHGHKIERFSNGKFSVTQLRETLRNGLLRHQCLDLDVETVAQNDLRVIICNYEELYDYPHEQGKCLIFHSNLPRTILPALIRRIYIRRDEIMLFFDALKYYLTTGINTRIDSTKTTAIAADIAVNYLANALRSKLNCE